MTLIKGDGQGKSNQGADLVYSYWALDFNIALCDELRGIQPGIIMSVVSSPVGLEGMLYIAPVHEFKAAILMFDKGGATFDPVAIIAIVDAVYLA